MSELADQTISETSVRQLEVFADSLHNLAVIYNDWRPAAEHLELASQNVTNAVEALREKPRSDA
ncbi:MAG: hypothetical protein WKF41_04060 [Gaiellaceae bacterium]